MASEGANGRLIEAVEAGNVELVRSLVSPDGGGADPALARKTVTLNVTYGSKILVKKQRTGSGGLLFGSSSGSGTGGGMNGSGESIVEEKEEKRVESVLAESALCLAVRSGRSDVVAVLVDAGAPPNSPISWRIPQHHNPWTLNFWTSQRWTDLPYCNFSSAIHFALTSASLPFNRRGATVALINPSHPQQCAEMYQMSPSFDIVKCLLSKGARVTEVEMNAARRLANLDRAFVKLLEAHVRNAQGGVGATLVPDRPPPPLPSSGAGQSGLGSNGNHPGAATAAGSPPPMSPPPSSPPSSTQLGASSVSPDSSPPAKFTPLLAPPPQSSSGPSPVSSPSSATTSSDSLASPITSPIRATQSQNSTSLYATQSAMSRSISTQSSGDQVRSDLAGHSRVVLKDGGTALGMQLSLPDLPPPLSAGNLLASVVTSGPITESRGAELPSAPIPRRPLRAASDAAEMNRKVTGDVFWDGPYSAPQLGRIGSPTIGITSAKSPPPPTEEVLRAINIRGNVSHPPLPHPRNPNHSHSPKIHSQVPAPQYQGSAAEGILHAQPNPHSTSQAPTPPLRIPFKRPPPPPPPPASTVIDADVSGDESDSSESEAEVPLWSLAGNASAPLPIPPASAPSRHVAFALPPESPTGISGTSTPLASAPGSTFTTPAGTPQRVPHGNGSRNGLQASSSSQPSSAAHSPVAPTALPYFFIPSGAFPTVVQSPDAAHDIGGSSDKELDSSSKRPWWDEPEDDDDEGEEAPLSQLAAGAGGATGNGDAKEEAERATSVPPDSSADPTQARLQRRITHLSRLLHQRTHLLLLLRSSLLSSGVGILSPDGALGIPVPATLPPPPGDLSVISQYVPNEEDEISLAIGEKIVCTVVFADGWGKVCLILRLHRDEWLG
ncbi:hypothetical protein M427DRAFT_140616 [Gonapodya prolifera JEL478]|uniref:Uncharacterized protein n=1 Tax=Gonapodya prolifera (strain JEL478) TaxID=1344416 RepID=A0A138ZYS7_GONPJ|nr:hypothetical protein M427DRAFT_140616 [Gonapodya prolifera JEL478]|eukprot:KXS09664.1 hypothetical protein M427DRAFT_140616 [Gonapodya prolifera JEL478]